MKKSARKGAKAQSMGTSGHNPGRLKTDMTGGGKWSIRAAGLSDTGLVRTRNEDAFLVDTEMGLFVVADGLGGHSRGDIAAGMIMKLLPRILKRDAVSVFDMSAGNAIQNRLRAGIVELNRDLRSARRERIEVHDMGATVVAALLDGACVHIAHMGDSRAYLLRGSELLQQTDDHSVVAMLLRHGEISAEEAEGHPARNSLTRFVGIDTEVGPDVRTVDLQPGDRLLLCSDGVWGMIEHDVLTRILAQGGTPEATCRKLIAEGINAGGLDNLTAVIVDVEGKI